jgi:hypothetical protein
MPNFVTVPGPRGPACVPNIGPKGRRQRATVGAVTIAIGLGILAALVLTGANPLWRLLLFIAFAGGGVSVLQATEKT